LKGEIFRCISHFGVEYVTVRDVLQITGICSQLTTENICYNTVENLLIRLIYELVDESQNK
jgi:hypothetical protein